MKEIQKIYNPSRWLMSLNRGDVAVGELLTSYADQSFSVMLSRFNARYGQERNIFVHYHFKRATKIMILVCVSWEEHLQEFKMKRYEEEWRKRIPIEYR